MRDKKLARVMDQVKLAPERENAILADLLREKKEVAGMKGNRRSRVPAMALVTTVLVAVVLAGTALAAVFSFPEVLSGWFSQTWEEQRGKPIEEAHLELLNRLTRPVGVSDTQNGVTVTVDSVTVGDSSLWALLVVDGLGGPLPEPSDEYDWDHMYHTGLDRTWIEPFIDGAFEVHAMCSGVSSSSVTEDGRLCLIYNWEPQISGNTSLLDGCRVKFQLYEIGYGNHTLAENTWELNFDLEPAEGTPVLVLHDVQFPAKEDGEPVLIDIPEARVSSTDITFRLDAGDSLRMAYHFDITLCLSDGTEIDWTELPEMGCHDDAENQWVVTKILPMPIDLAQVESLRVGDAEFPLQ